MIWMWVGFIVFVLIVLALDLGVFNRKAHVVTVREALVFVLATAGLAACFTVFVYFGYERHWLGLGSAIDQVDGSANDGRLAALKFFTGYLIEMSLSMDNVFVIALIFDHLRVPAQYQHRVLFWGILGALLMRGAMIGIGAQLVQRYHWVLYVFGLFLLYTAFRMLLAKQEEQVPEESGIVRLLARLAPISSEFNQHHFLVRSSTGALMLTPLAVTLVLIEFTDLLFAVDSIPAIFAVTTDPFLVFTSNVFAILALRSLYFALAGAIREFRYLKASLALILAVVGLKMLAAKWITGWLGESSNFYLLGVVALLFGGGIVASKLSKSDPA
jgi:tellurite resistance protein TerC